MSGLQLEPVPAKFADRWGRDWHCVDLDTARKIANVPGVQLLPDQRPILHLTHLPLLDLAPEFSLGCSGEARAKYYIDDQIVRPWHPEGISLRRWQEEAVAFIADRRASLIRFDPRMGKTYVGVAAHDPATGPLVVVAPVAAREVWREWILRRWPHAKLLEAEGRRMSVADVREADAVFIHYDILPSWSMPGLRIGTLVIDEPHRLFGHRTMRSNTVAMMGPQAHRIVALDGTPIWNRPASFWSLLSILAPGAWGSYYTFAERYAGGYRNPFGGITTGKEATNAEELKARLSELVLDRSWEGFDLLRRETHVVEIDEETRIEIDLQANAAVQSNTTGGAAKLGALRHALARTKIPEILKVVAASVSNRVGAAGLAPGNRANCAGGLDRPSGAAPGYLVVWCWHRDVASRLVIALSRWTDAYVISGDDAPSSRVETLNEWRQEGGVLVATLGIGLVAIDLSVAAHAIFAEIDWTPAVLEQAEMRIAHPSRPATVTYVIVDHPIERAVIETLGSKSQGMSSIGIHTFSDGAEALSRAFGVDGPDLERLRKALQ